VRSQPDTGFQIQIKNLPDSVDADQLKKAFKGYGDIIKSRVPMDREGQSLCYGFVEFEDKEAAHKAVKEMDRAKFNGQVV
jgi:RNA recognition motif-containing protein